MKKLTLEPAKIQDADVQKMRDAGWTDEEIYEATFDTALFAFFNRMADAYGLDYPSQGWHPPAKGAGASASADKTGPQTGK